MIREKKYARFVLFSFLTCGIYSIFYYCRMISDVNAVCRGDGKKTMNYIAAGLLNIVTFGFFMPFWLLRLGIRLQENALRYDTFKYSRGGLFYMALDIAYLFICFIPALLSACNINFDPGLYMGFLGLLALLVLTDFLTDEVNALIRAYNKTIEKN